MEELSGLERELDSTEIDSRSFLQKAKDWYFHQKSFEISGKMYEFLGVKTFKKYCPTGEVWNKYLNDRDVKGNSTADLMNYEKQTRIFEGIHLGFFSLMTPMMIASLAEGNYKSAAINAVINTLVNVYPIMTQRYNRSRIQNIVEKREAKEMPAPY